MNGVAWALLALALASALGANDHDANDTDTTTADSPEVTTLLSVNDKVCNVTWDTEVGDQLKVTWTGDLDGQSSVFIEATRICSAGLSCDESKQNQTTTFSAGTAAFRIEPDSEYSVNVDFLCPVDDNSRTVRSPPIKLSVPRNLRVVNKSNTSVELIWDVVNPPEGTDFWYIVELRNSSIEGTVDTGNSTWFTVTHLAPFTNYTFRVRIETERGQEGKWSEEVATRTEVGVPLAPGGLKAAEVTETTISLEWQEPQPSSGPITMYRIRWMNATQEAEIKVDKSLSYKVDGLTPDATYTFKILAVTVAGPGEWSEELKVQTKGREISVPRNLRVVSKSNTSVELIWDVVNPPEDSDFWYIVELRNGTIEGTVNAGQSTWFTVMSLAPFTNYTFRVRIETKGSQEGNWSEEVTARTEVGVPHAPRGLNAVEVTKTTISLEWQEPESSTGPITTYRIRWRNATQEAEIKIGKSLNYKVDGLTPNTNYTFKVLAVTKAGSGEYSEELEVQTKGGELSVPINPRVVGKSNTSVELIWDVVNPPEDSDFWYVVELRNSSIEWTVDAGNSTWFTVPHLAPFTNYTFRVRIETDMEQEGKWSEEVATRTEVGVPYTPRGFKAVEVTNTTISLEWQDPQPSTGPVTMYRIRWRNATQEADIKVGKSLNFTVGGLVPDTSYTIKVLAVTKAGPGEWSEELQIQTERGVLFLDIPVPTNLRLIGKSNTSVELAWDVADPPATPDFLYIIEMKNSSIQGSVDTQDKSKQFEITDLAPYTNYTFRVRIETVPSKPEGEHEGQWSEELEVQTDVGVPHAPRELKVQNVTNTSVAMEWQEPTRSTGPVSLYRISWRDNNSEGIVDLDNSLYCILGGLAPYVEYSFRVMAITVAGPGQWSEELLIQTDVGVPDAPRDLEVDDITNTTVRLKWSPPENSTGPILEYRVRWNNRSHDGELYTTDNSTVCLVSGLAPYVSYFFQVAGTTSAGSGQWSDGLEVLTDVGVPHAPTAVEAFAVSNTSVSLRWAEPEPSTGPIEKYRIHWMRQSGPGGEVDTKDNDTSSTVTGLSPSVKYAFKVLALTRAGKGGWSKELVVSTKIGIPRAPTALRAGKVSNTTAFLSWTQPDASTGPILRYRLHWKNASGEGERNTSTAATFFSIDGLMPYTQYTLKVLAVTEAGPGPWSEVLNVTTEIGVPYAPTNFEAMDVGNTTVRLQWKEPAVSTGPILHYLIHWKNGNTDREISTMTNETTPYTLGKLTPYTIYVSKVLAVTQAGPGQWSEILKIRTKVGVPPAPMSLRAESVGNTSVHLRWDDPTVSVGPILMYRIHWSNSNAEGEIKVVNTTSHTMKSLVPYTQYTFKVLAITEAGPGRWSETLKVQTKAGVPSAPVSVRPTSLSNTTVSLSWEAPETSSGPILRYRVFWKKLSAEGDLDTHDNSTSITVQGLTPYSKYAFRVQAVTEAGAGQWSDTLMVQTYVGVPYPPTALTQLDLSNTSLTLTWNEPGISTGPILNFRILWQNSSSTGEVDLVSARTSHTLNHLTPFEKYSLKVQACTTAGCGRWSNVLEIRTKVGVPTAPRNLVLDRATDVSLQISWTRPLHPHAPSMEYVIVWRESEENANETEIVIHGDIAREVVRHAITDLLPFTLYSVRVSAVTTAGIGVSTTLLEAATLVGVPQPATIRNVAIVKERTVRVEWVTRGHWPGPVGFSLQAWKYPDPCSGRLSPTVDAEVKGFPSASEWGGRQSTVVGGLCPHCKYSFLLLLKTTATDGVKSVSSDIVQLPPEASSEPRNVTSECNWSSTKAIVNWAPPLRPNGKIINYRIWYGIEGASDIKSSIVDAVDVCSSHRHTISYMKPEKRYIITVTATVEGVMEDGKAGYARGTCVLPAGIPSLGDMSRLQAKSSSSPGLAVLEWTKDVFSEEMGAIILYTVFVGKKGALGSSEAGEVANSNPSWSNFSSGFSDFYQATPLDWNPFTMSENDPLGCEISSIVEENNRTLLRCFIGIQKHCPENVTFCNGPLMPDTTYEMKIRGYTKGGYNETRLMIVRTGLVPKESMVPTIITVVLVLVLLASLTAGCFVMKKKGLLAPLTDTFRTRLGSPKDVAACGDMGVEMQKGKTNRCIKAKHFAEHVRLMMSDSHLQFAQEFEALKKDSPQHPCSLAETEENRLKNRWMNIFPFDHSRVKLLPLCDEPASDFINANYIPGFSSPREYIATQGPLPHTLEDFWRMVWEQAVTSIVMLTQCVERGKKKCEQYWPNPGEYQYFGDLVVATLSESILSTYVIRILHVQLGSYERQVKQMHFTHWPDFGCPQCPEDLINFVNAVRDHLPRTSPGPILVHCSAGVGRTGTFIAVDRLARKLLNAPLYSEDTIDVYGTVLELRNHRTNMVQTEDQYIYIHLCVSRLIRERDRPYPRGENIYSNMGIEKDTPL